MPYSIYQSIIKILGKLNVGVLVISTLFANEGHLYDLQENWGIVTKRQQHLWEPYETRMIGMKVWMIIYSTAPNKISHHHRSTAVGVEPPQNIAKFGYFLKLFSRLPKISLSRKDCRFFGFSKSIPKH